MRATSTIPASRIGALVAGPSLARAAVVLGTGVVLVLVALVVAVGSGTSGLAGPADAAAILAHHVGLPVPVTWTPGAEQIVWELRLPRAVTALVVGGGLATAGVVFQALLRNPLADPYVIGTAAGASLGAVAGLMIPALAPALVLGAGSAWWGIGLAQGLAFVCGLGTVLVVYAVARTGGRVPVVTLLLVGYAISSVLAAGTALLMFFAGNRLGAIFGWLMGSLGGASWNDLALATPLVAGAAVAILVRWRRLNLLLLGDGPAAHLGLDVEREKLLLTVLATLATSAAVAVAGTIGFVGLVVPHLLRLVLGPDHRLLLPASFLVGAALLALADTGARLVGGVPVGVVTALLGAPFFLVLLRRTRALGG
jgi:iron complex transport system permease protein